MFSKTKAQQLLAQQLQRLKIGQPSLQPAVHSSVAAAAAASARPAAAPIPAADHKFNCIETSGGFYRESQWHGSPPSASGQASIKNFWSNRLGAHIKYHTKREQQEHNAKQVRERDEVYMDPQPNRGNAGDLRLQKLQWWLNNLGVLRSPDQQLFHVHFTNACLPKIYGEFWNESCVRVMASRGIKKIQNEVLATTPRRWGKTWSVALFVLALMLACPGIRVCVFSTGKRASGSLMEIMLQFLGNVPSLRGRVAKQNQEELYIAANALQQGQSAESAAAKEQRQLKTTVRS